MANEALDRIRSEVLALTEAERAELAHDLLASLDEPRDAGVEEAWEREILHRISLIDSGQAKLLDREDFRQRMRERYKDQ